MPKERLHAHTHLEDASENLSVKIWKDKPPDFYVGTICNDCIFEFQGPIPKQWKSWSLPSAVMYWTASLPLPATNSWGASSSVAAASLPTSSSTTPPPILQSWLYMVVMTSSSCSAPSSCRYASPRASYFLNLSCRDTGADIGGMLAGPPTVTFNNPEFHWPLVVVTPWWRIRRQLRKKWSWEAWKQAC